MKKHTPTQRRWTGTGAKYVYGESIYKSAEGGMPGGQTLFKRLNKWVKGDDVYFQPTPSPYVGHWSPTVYAKTQKAMKKGLTLAKGYGFFSGTLKSQLRESKERL